MADHDVTLTYTPGEDEKAEGTVTADPFTIAVRPGQTIAFALGDGSQKGLIRLTFADRRFFKTNNPKFHEDGVFHDSDGVVTVVTALTGRTTYQCELMDPQDKVIGRSHEKGGGEVVPSNLDGGDLTP